MIRNAWKRTVVGIAMIAAVPCLALAPAVASPEWVRVDNTMTVAADGERNN